VLTTKITLPLYWHKDCGFSSCSLAKVWFNKAGHAAEVFGVAPAGCAHAADTASKKTQARMCLSVLKLAIELSILFCDWTVYFYFSGLSRAF
jgi:hypothetical protein